MKFALFLFIFVSAPILTFAACPQNHDDMECTISNTNGLLAPITHRQVNFTVHSSTYLCDGKSNPYFFQEFALDGTYVAQIVADFEDVRFSFYHVADVNRWDPLADVHGPRAQGDEDESLQSLTYNYGDHQYLQIMCATVKRY